MTHYIALLRGINVGRAKRIAMADLRTLLADLGFANVRTLLNSGNAVFHSDGRSTRDVAAALEAAISSRFGFEVAVVVVSGAELNLIVDENPLPAAGGDPARHLVAFARRATALSKAKQLLEQPWEPDALVLGKKAAYLWCADGVLESKLAKAFARATADTTTTRNWATVLKLQRAVVAARARS